jgi:hypothetical protein
MDLSLSLPAQIYRPIVTIISGLYSLACKVWLGFVISLRPQTLKDIKGGWLHYSDTSEPVDGNGAQLKSGHCPIRVWNQRPFDHWPNALTEPITVSTYIIDDGRFLACEDCGKVRV